MTAGTMPTDSSIKESLIPSGTSNPNMIDFTMPGPFHTINSTFLDSTPNSGQASKEASEYMPGGSTRSSLWSAPYGLTFASGSGSTLTDIDGHTYDDFLGEYSAGLFGHSNVQIKAAIHEALDRGWNLGGQSEYEQALAKAVVGRFAPAIEMVRFTNSGTEANTMALAATLAWHHTPHIYGGRDQPKHEIMVFEGGYHGGTLRFPMQDALTVLNGHAANAAMADGHTANDKVQPLITPDDPINLPHNFVVAPYNDEEAVLNLAHQHSATLAAVLVEPMQGNAGARTCSRAFLQSLREICNRTGALLIFDEVQTSRLGPKGLGEKMMVKPDLMTLGKWIGGGMTFGAFGGRRDIMAMFDLSGHTHWDASGGATAHTGLRKTGLQHAGTFNNNVFSMSAGLAGLRIASPEALQSLNERGDNFRRQLMSLLPDAGLGTEDDMWISGIGSIMSVNFGGRWRKELQAAWFQFMLEQGIYFSPRGFMALSLEITEDQIEKFVKAAWLFIETFKSIIKR